MARNYTSLHNSFLTSDTIAEMSDTDEAIFIRLLIVSDDWGRFPYDPAKIKRLASDFKHDIPMIQLTLELLLQHKCIHKYEVNDKLYCEWVEWDTYQSFRFKNEALYPSESGVYEPTNNPLASENRKKNPRNKSKQNRTKSNITKQILRDDVSDNNSDDLSQKPASDNKFRLISDTYYRLYDEKFGGKPGWGSKEQKRVKELFERYPDDSPQMIADTIEYMFKHQDKLWTENLGVFISLTGLHFDKARTLAFGGKNSNSYHCPRLCDDTAKFTKTDLGKPCPVCGSGITEFVN